MGTLTKGYVMELLKKESNDLSELLLPANEIKSIEIIGEGIVNCFCIANYYCL